MHVSVSPFFTISLAASALCAVPADLYLRAPRSDVPPRRRTLAQLHRDLFRSRYSGADLRRLTADPNRRECLRRRARATRWTSAMGTSAFSLANARA